MKGCPSGWLERKPKRRVWRLATARPAQVRGAQGGYARAAKLSPERRAEIARRAAAARWGA